MLTVTAPPELSIDPRTGGVTIAIPVSQPAEIEAVLAASAQPAATCADVSPATRGGWLEALADAVTAAADELVALADTETGLGDTRLGGEVQRCAAQLRFYAAVGREGSWLGVTIDHATSSTPDLRRVQLPLGPVLVFGASNFPFAFGALGNDTGAALAAGCPVIVKGNPAHPLTHARLVEIAVGALAEAGAPTGILGSVTGFEAGRELVLAEAIHAVAFTGSQAGGMALWSLAQSRRRVVPVYAEMGTVNPVVVTRAAAAADAGALASGCAESFTLGMGQFCTKPGILFVPAGSGLGEDVATALLAAVADPGPGTAVSAVVLGAHPDLLYPGSPVLAECFGPALVVVEYAGTAELGRILATLEGALVGSVMTAGAADEDAAGVVAALSGMVGRVAVDAWPTGVATTWAQQHGGPWPTTTVPHATSVGAAALGRFTRPVAFQNAPSAVLPPAVIDANPWMVTRRVDGGVRVPRAT